ncbi:NADP-dependent oxidoreductase domain-containing protein [Diaporthe sp. PMI_573]|nr:NADP-dependent oxidoreductase domain-containing protein [Diaporthaceae sp. PMI_573]
MVKILSFANIKVPVPGFSAIGLSFAIGTNLSLEEAKLVLLKAIKKYNIHNKVFITSKCRFNVFSKTRYITNSASYIKEYIKGIIKRLGFALDLYYLYYIDLTTSLKESITTLDKIRKAGKTKYIKLSKCSTKTLCKANSKYSLFKILYKTNGLIDACKELSIAFIAFSPLGYSFLIDNF